MPPRAGSGSLKMSHASTNAGSARITNAARQESVAIPPVTLKADRRTDELSRRMWL